MAIGNPPNVSHTMERVGALINKLKEQFEQHADAEKLSVTARLLLCELQSGQEKTVNKGKVSVVLPAFVPSAPPTQSTTAQPAAIQPVAVRQVISQPVKPVITQVTPPAPPPQKKDVPNNWLLNKEEAIPTFAHQEGQEEKEILELNDHLVVSANGSLNEKLKEDRVEIATLLQGSPIRDLKKAVGVNDRYQFVNDLFRGDESMYERCLKTINGFNIYPEAQYWIQRELKVKMGWNENSETVKLFDQLVRRRFA